MYNNLSAESTTSVLSSGCAPVTLTDILLIVLLGLASFRLYKLGRRLTSKTSNSTSDSNRLPVFGHIFQAKTSHARFLPDPAKHVFSYPVLYLGMDLDALESNQLDESIFASSAEKSKSKGGKLFKYDPQGKWSILAIRPKVYLDPTNEAMSIKSKLHRQLAARGIDLKFVEKVYTLTMPGFMGFQDINPLTVHFTYSIDRITSQRRLRIVVLEVSNTFGEKHLYVLRCGIEEDEKVRKGFSHQWTFPRAFHVSPFNDRTGFYRVAISDPLASSEVSNGRVLPAVAELNVNIVFLTADHQKKFYASLSGKGENMTRNSLLSAIVRWPLTLLLTTPRILYQAAKLHYSKKLDVFPKPEPLVASEKFAPRINKIQTGGQAGNVEWQRPSSMEISAQDKMLKWMQFKLNQLAILSHCIEIVLVPPPNSRQETIRLRPQIPDSPIRQVLTITYFSNQFFTDVYTAPSARWALEMASHGESRWFVSDENLFIEIFELRLESECFTKRMKQAQSFRVAHFKWSLSFVPALENFSIDFDSSPVHSCDWRPQPTRKDLFALWFHFFLIKLGYWIFWLTRARFVAGTEPWAEWARWVAKKAEKSSQSETSVEFGSVLRKPTRIEI